MRQFFSMLIFVFYIIFSGDENQVVIPLVNQEQHVQNINTSKVEFIDKVISNAEECINIKSFYYIQSYVDSASAILPFIDFVEKLVNTKNPLLYILPLFNISFNIGALKLIFQQFFNPDLTGIHILKDTLNSLNFVNISKDNLQKKVLELSNQIIFSKKLISTGINDAYIDRIALFECASLINNAISFLFEPQSEITEIKSGYFINMCFRGVSLPLLLAVKKYILGKGKEKFKTELESLLNNYNFDEV